MPTTSERTSSRRRNFVKHSDTALRDLHAGTSSLQLYLSRLLLLLTPLTMVVVAGSGEPWALGLFSAFVGLAFLLAPPTLRVSRWISWPLLGILLFSLGAFLPISANSLPDWRAPLVGEYRLPIPMTHSPQPWVSLESWLLMAVGLAWLYYCLARGFGSRERRWLVRGQVVGIAAIAVVAMVFKFRAIHVPFWEGEYKLDYYGPFPNRNRFSTLLAIGSVLALASAYDALRNRNRWWIFYGLLIAPIFAAILLNTSVGGVLLFFMGLGLWMLTASFHKRSGQKMAIFASILLLLAAGFLLFGQNIQTRFKDAFITSGPITGNARVQLLGESLSMLSHTPLFGIGLGCFDPVFALNKTWTDHRTRTIHPEGDWIWLFSETGLCVMACVFIAVVALLQRVSPWRTGESSGKRDRRLRNAAAIGALLVAIHGFTDGPGHTVAIWALVSVLLGLASRPRRSMIPAPGTRRPLAFGIHLLFGLLCLAASVNWLCTAFALPSLPSASMAEMLHRRALIAADHNDFAGATKLIGQAIAQKPMDLRFYFDRAQWLLNLQHPPQEALQDFDRANVLEPHIGKLCMDEFDIWLKHELPVYAIPALREAMARDRIRAQDFYNYSLGFLPRFPEMRDSLRLLASDSKLKLLYLNNAQHGPDFDQVLQSLLVEHPTLDDLTPREKATLFSQWYLKGDQAQLIAQLERNAEWRLAGWSVLAEHRASQGDFHGAFQLATEHVPAPMESVIHGDDLEQLQRAFAMEPTDIRRGLELYEVQKQHPEQTDLALATLEKVAALPGAPVRLLYEEAILYSRKRDFSHAWEKMKAYLSQKDVSQN